MYAVTGVSGQTGRATADALLKAGRPLRVVVRTAGKGEEWAARGAEVALADIGDAGQLAAALSGADAAYLLNPPAYGAEDPFAVAAAIADGFAEAIERSDVARVVVLSSISAHLARGNGIIQSNRGIERRLSNLAKPVTFLRPGFFLENWAHVMPAVHAKGVFPSMLALDRPVPMVAVADIGALAAKLMTETWLGRRIVELSGPTYTTPEFVAGAIAKMLGKPVAPIAVPRESWADILAGSGMSPRAVAAFVEMYDGFNDGTIRFEGGQPRRGSLGISDLAPALVAAAPHF